MFHLTVDPQEVAVHYRDGALVAVLPPGRHRRTRRSRYARVDLRSRLTTIATQEVPSSDGVLVKVTATVQWHVGDPVAFLQQSQDPFAEVYLAVQVALREQLGTLEVADVVSRGREVAAEAVESAAASAAGRVGITVRAVVVKDVVLPPELRQAYAEVVMSRQRAQTQLEAARAETAALRSMANVAKLLDDHPALARLRMIQAVPYGSKIVIDVPEGLRD